MNLPGRLKNREKIACWQRSTARNLFLALALALLYAPPALAWNEAGHRIVAALAWRELRPEAKAQITALLRRHPAYAGLWKPALATASSERAGQTLFLQAAVWPDTVRTPGNPYNHAPWRYIAHPYVPDAFRSRFAPADDVRADSLTEQITLRQDTLRSPDMPQREQAISLCWLVFLAAEAHQPLSCATLFSPAFPHSDRNGQDFWVRTAAGPASLHAFWDSLPGAASGSAAIQREAGRISAAYPHSLLAETASKEPEAWGWESAALAATVYRQGRLRGSSLPQNAHALPPNYAKAAHSLADRRLALAAYRLADILNLLFASTK